MKKTRNILYVGIAVIAVSGGGLVWHMHGANPVVHVSPAVTEAASAVASTEEVATGTELVMNSNGTGINAQAIAVHTLPPAGYVEYRNAKYRFAFYHLPEANVKEYDEGGGAMTVVLENIQEAKGMQVFIVPYAEQSISEERFKRDVPSGVRTNVENATLDGVRAVTFNSFDQFLGDTREIWVIRNGYLYEITTFAGVGDWFTPIIQSWDFF